MASPLQKKEIAVFRIRVCQSELVAALQRSILAVATEIEPPLEFLPALNVDSATTNAQKALVSAVAVLSPVIDAGCFDDSAQADIGLPGSIKPRENLFPRSVPAILQNSRARHQGA